MRSKQLGRSSHGVAIARRWALPSVLPEKWFPDANTVEVTSCVDLHTLQPDVQASRGVDRIFFKCTRNCCPDYHTLQIQAKNGIAALYQPHGRVE